MIIGNSIGIKITARGHFGVIPTTAASGDPQDQPRRDFGLSNALPVKARVALPTSIKREPDKYTPSSGEPSPIYPDPATQRRQILARKGAEKAA